MLDVGRSPIARFLRAWMGMTYDPHLEAKSIDSSRFGSLIATGIFLPFVLARLCRSAQFGRSGIPYVVSCPSTIVFSGGNNMLLSS